jgi:hypothetical protein
VRGSGIAAGNGGGNEGDVGARTKMILLSLIPALSRGGEQGNATNGVLLNTLGAIDSGFGAGSSNTAEAGSLNLALVNTLKELLTAACGPASSLPGATALNANPLDHARIRALPMQKAKGS